MKKRTSTKVFILSLIAALLLCGQSTLISPPRILQTSEDLDAFRTSELAAHNTKRALHGTPALALSDTLNGQAQEWADYLASLAAPGEYILEHSGTDGVGENIAFRLNWGAYPQDSATISWYSEISNYDFETGESSNGGVTGHFTQLVWKSSQQVGFGLATIPDPLYGKWGYNRHYVVAQYSPPGNFHTYGQRQEDYTTNVPALI